MNSSKKNYVDYRELKTVHHREAVENLKTNTIANKYSNV